MNVRRTLFPLVAIVAATLAPTALAERPDDRSGSRGPGAIAADLSSPTRPDDRSGARGPGAYEPQQLSAAVRPDDRSGLRGPGAVSTLVVQSPSGSFDWDDAVIGSLGGIGMSLVVAGLLFLLTSRRNRIRTA